MTATRKAIIISLASIFFIGFASFAVYANTQPVQTVEPIATVQLPPPSAEEILRMVNEERAKVGVAPLIVFEPAVRSAQFKADDMVKNDYFAHKAPGSDRNNGLDYLDTIDENVCDKISENIVWVRGEGSYNSKAAMDWWMQSEPHKEAILAERYTHTGIGIADKKIVQHFCIAK